jgi:hypothetical protein
MLAAVRIRHLPTPDTKTLNGIRTEHWNSEATNATATLKSEMSTCFCSYSWLSPGSHVNAAGFHATGFSTRYNGSNKWWSWDPYNLKQLATILNTVGEENHLLLLDIVKISVWSGVRYKLPAENSSNNDEAHSGHDHVTLCAFKTRPTRPTQTTAVTTSPDTITSMKKQHARIFSVKPVLNKISRVQNIFSAEARFLFNQGILW